MPTEPQRADGDAATTDPNATASREASAQARLTSVHDHVRHMNHLSEPQRSSAYEDVSLANWHGHQLSVKDPPDSREREPALDM